MPSDPRLLFPEIHLKRSPKSETYPILYSANLSSRYGSGSRMEIYISPARVPTPPPEVALLMVYEGSETAPSPEILQKLVDLGSGAEPLLVPMNRCRDPGHVVRFDADSSDPFRTIYLPAKMAKDHRQIWAHVVFADR